MTGRVSRTRAPVNYNDKNNMEAAWIAAAIKPAKTATPVKKAKKSSQTASGSAEKENSKASKNSSKSKSVTKQPKAQEAAPSKEAPSVKKTLQTKKTSKSEKTPKAGSRGRNAGVTVVPIVDKKAKTPKVSGLRKLQAEEEEPAPKPAALPKPPTQPKQVPGLPGIVQKAAAVASKPVAESRPGSAKHGATSKLPSPKAPAPSKRPPSPLAHVQATKKSRQEAPAPPAAAAAARPRSSARASVLQRLPPSPEPLHLSPLPANDIADKLDEMRSNFANMAELCTKLQQENAEFKTARIRDDVEGVIAEQTNAVMDHGRKASDLAQHWKDEADRMQELVEQLRGGILQEELRSVHAELAIVRQELLDRDIAAAQKEKAVVELQTRNKFLERHARIPVTKDKCVGTEPAAGVNTWVQVPHGMELNQARAFVPEGAAGSSLYTAGGGAGMGRAGAGGPVYVDASYTLANQRTNAYAQSGSDMQLASRRAGPGFPGTFESVQQRNNTRGVGTRRMSAPVAPLIGPDGLPRQIQFYSNNSHSNGGGAAGGGLQAVPEEPHETQAMPGAGMLPPGEAELLATCGIIVSGLSGGRLLYTHPLTGYRFELGPAPLDSDDAEVDSVVYDLMYRPIAFGTAQGYIQEIPGFGEVLLGDFALASANRAGLVEKICQGLQAAHRQ